MGNKCPNCGSEPANMSRRFNLFECGNDEECRVETYKGEK